jgi:hypothetical protein
MHKATNRMSGPAVAELVDKVFQDYDDNMRQNVRQALREDGVSSMRHCSLMQAAVLVRTARLSAC